MCNTCAKHVLRLIHSLALINVGKYMEYHMCFPSRTTRLIGTNCYHYRSLTLINVGNYAPWCNIHMSLQTIILIPMNDMIHFNVNFYILCMNAGMVRNNIRFSIGLISNLYWANNCVQLIRCSIQTKRNRICVLRTVMHDGDDAWAVAS